MRILVLANFDVGLYNFRKELLQKLLEDGNEVYISLPYGEKVNLLVDMGCKFIETHVDRRGINPITDFKLLWEYYKLIKKVRPDKVISYTIKPNIYGGMICRFMKVPLYANITGLGTAFQGDGFLRKFVTLLYKFSFKKVKCVFFENVENRNVFIDNKIIPEKKSYLLNGAGVNLEEYPFSDYPECETIHFLFVGRVMKEKGIDELFYSAKKLKENGYNVQVDVVGPFEDDYKDITESLDKDGIINYHGFQDDVKPFIKNAHCFVLPSYHEGMANTLLENGAMGRPLITSNIHGCKETVVEGVSGYLCECQNAEDLYEKMERFVKLPYEEKVAMGRNSKKLMEEVFDKRKIVEETMRRIFE